MEITCFFVKVGSIADTLLQPLDIASLKTQVERYFLENSNADIHLNVDLANFADSFDHEFNEVEARNLHETVRLVTRNDPKGEKKVNRIAVLFSSFYKPERKALGVMFDRGEPTWDDPNNLTRYKALAREGCAVFLGAIRNIRPIQQDYEREVLFTLIHEIGHIFNLQHRQPPPTFMTESAPSKVFGDGAFKFHDLDRDLLAKCSSSPFIWPGGSPFGNLGDVKASFNAPHAPSRASKPKLKLRISMKQLEFWSFEPIELDLRLIVREKNRSMSIPHILDPGYDRFKIWIKDPIGEQRLYQSSMHYCDTKIPLFVSPQRPFQRDISLFLENGRYTFQRAGEHKIWATLDLGKRGLLRSNTLTVSIKPTSLQYEACRDLLPVLRQPRIAKLLYYRAGPDEDIQILRDFARSIPLPFKGLAGALSYCTGRALLKAAAQVSNDRSTRLRQEGIEDLKFAVDQPSLGVHRCCKASEYIEQYSASRSKRAK